jgi:hypothetical protein
VSQSSPTVNLAVLLVALVFGAVAYFASERFKRDNGVTPWNWPSWVWALVACVSWLVCLILFLIAKDRTTRSLSQSGNYGGHPSYPGAYPFHPSANSNHPSAYTYPHAYPSSPDVAPGYAPGTTQWREDRWNAGSPADPDAHGASDPTGAQATPTAMPAWHHDPSGRFAWRYWDGMRWTEHVSDGTSAGSDPR